MDETKERLEEEEELKEVLSFIFEDTDEEEEFEGFTDEDLSLSLNNVRNKLNGRVTKVDSKASKSERDNVLRRAKTNRNFDYKYAHEMNDELFADDESSDKGMEECDDSQELLTNIFGDTDDEEEFEGFSDGEFDSSPHQEGSKTNRDITAFAAKGSDGERNITKGGRKARVNIDYVFENETLFTDDESSEEEHEWSNCILKIIERIDDDETKHKK